MKTEANALQDLSFLARVISDSLVKLNPLHQMRNPVMFVVFVAALIITGLWIEAIKGGEEGKSGFIFSIGMGLWSTVLFANAGESFAEGRSRAQANFLRGAKRELSAKRLKTADLQTPYSIIPAAELRIGDLVLAVAGDFIPGDGEVIEGVASVDESAITGESAPVIRESGGDFSSVTGGTRVLSDALIIRITANPGDAFLDRMIEMVEGASRQRTPNEIALTILLVALTVVLLLTTTTLLPFSIFASQVSGVGQPVPVPVLLALLVCLIPTTIGGLLSAIGIAGIGRMMQKNVIATSGRAVEAAGDVDVLLLDKTGTITLGNRRAATFIPLPGIEPGAFARAAQLSSLADETPEGRSIVVLAKRSFGIREQDVRSLNAKFIQFSAKTRMSGVDLPAEVLGGKQKRIRKGSADAVKAFVHDLGGHFPEDLQRLVDEVSRRGSTPLVVAESAEVLGIIELRDVVKGGIRERFSELRRMGIQTVMITGDNRLTAAAIAAEAGVDNFLAEATPEMKLSLIRDYQCKGKLVAMTGDGTNDAPALAQADVAVAMNSGTQAAKEAGNMVDLDSNPTKLIEIVETGKQMLMTRGSLTTLSISNDIAKYFAIIPAAFAETYPILDQLNVMRLRTPESAILSAVIFNALILVALIPLALNGVRYRSEGAEILLRDNLLIYGLGGLILPFVGIKVIDLALVSLGWV